MKRTLIILLSILALILLAVRGLFLHGSRSEDDRKWFIRNLDYDFAARIDSVGTIPNRPELHILYFLATTGKFNPSNEHRLDQQLKHRHMQFISRAGKSYRIFIKKPAEQGDSLFVNSKDESIIVHRNGKQVFHGSIGGSAYGQPWR